jgi:hypothetical protein
MAEVMAAEHLKLVAVLVAAVAVVFLLLATRACFTPETMARTPRAAAVRFGAASFLSDDQPARLVRGPRTLAGRGRTLGGCSHWRPWW